MNGYMLMQQIQSRSPERGRWIPAIALATDAGESEWRRTLAVEFQPHLPQSVEPETSVGALSAGVKARFQDDFSHPIRVPSLTGKMGASNLTLACHPCNQAKGNREIGEFLNQKPDLLNQKVGTYSGRVLCRDSSSFDLVTGAGRVSGIDRKYCQIVQRKDGYSYA